VWPRVLFRSRGRLVGQPGREIFFTRPRMRPGQTSENCGSSRKPGSRGDR
jgi:hypothetical protein